jgi:hypothetical protein
MDRGSDKHSPRIDDEMERETQSMTQGSPIEARAQDSRLKEPPDDDTPGPDPGTDDR